MGILDEAIREHLDLKRRHGADPVEVSKLESEVFGPARRPAPAVPAEDPTEAPVAAAPPLEAAPEAPDPVEPFDVPTEEPELADEEPQPTRAFDADEVRAAAEWAEEAPAEAPEHEEIGESVLDDTPEFLSDTPEHDRLWFEQRPPRDFDF